MIPLQASGIELEQIRALIIEKIEHTYLNKFIQRPNIDEEKLAILSMIVNNTDLSESTKRQYIITTILVQIALDTHDLVSSATNKEECETTITTRQLTVLGGDYYSGLYYLLLSEIEEIDLIHVLASAIKEINEYKMKLYYQEFKTFHEYIQIVKKVESLLIVRVAEYLNSSVMIGLAEKVIITKRLIQEKTNFHNRGSSPILDNWSTYSINSTYLSIMNTVESIIQENTNQIEEILLQPPLRLSVFKNQIRYMLNRLIYNNITVAEEG